MKLHCKGCIDIRHCLLIDKKHNKRCKFYTRIKPNPLKHSPIANIKDWNHIDTILNQYGIYNIDYIRPKLPNKKISCKICIEVDICRFNERQNMSGCYLGSYKWRELPFSNVKPSIIRKL